MAPVLAPWQAGHEIACCLYLGALVGALRALAPARGRWAFLPDMALVGMLLLFLQSYAAGYSDAGSLRWYMVLAGFAGALGAHSLLGPLAGQAWRALLWPGARGPAGSGPPGKRQKRRQKTKKRACKTSGICCIIQTYNTSVVRSLIHRRRTQWHGPVRRQKRSGGR